MNYAAKGALSGGVAGLLVVVFMFALDLGGLATLALSTNLATVAIPLMAIKLAGIFAIGGMVTSTVMSNAERGHTAAAAMPAEA